MGGHAAGEIASGTIINTIASQSLNSLLPSQITQNTEQDRLTWLRTAVEHANKAVFDLRKSAGTDMGSTLVAAIMEGNKAHIAHVGDSRAYLINAAGITRLTTDHSLVERLIATNQITPEEARHHPQRNVIYRTIGDKSKIDVEVATHKLSVDDYLLLCSDGLCGMVEDPIIYQTVTNAGSPQVACDQLINAANTAGGEDNITVIIIQIVHS
jgi:protein phosphatase